MKRENYIKIDQLLGRFVKEYGLENGLQRTEVFNAWDEAVGDKLSKYTTNKFFKDNTLYCTISSSVVRDKLFMRRVQIIDRINEIIGDGCVKRLILK